MTNGGAVYLGCVAAIGIINALPLLGVLGVGRLENAYGIAVEGPDLTLLLRHRALLFGLIGGLVLVSLGLPQLRVAALVLAALSMGGFVVLTLLMGDIGPPLQRIVLIDCIGLLLVVAAVLLRRSGQTQILP